MRMVCVCLLFALIHSFCFADKPTPEPYTKDEFTSQEISARRFEVTFFGSLPFTWLVSTLLYDVGRFSVKSISGASDASLYAPLFFAPSNKPKFTADEIIGMSISALTISLIVAIADNAILEDKKTQNIQKELETTENSKELNAIIGIDFSNFALNLRNED